MDQVEDESAALASVEYRRGAFDAKAGHGPVLMGGPYFEGFCKHATGPTRSWVMGIKRSRQRDEIESELRRQIKTLESEVELLKDQLDSARCTFPEGLCSCPHFRGQP